MGKVDIVITVNGDPKKLEITDRAISGTVDLIVRKRELKLSTDSWGLTWVNLFEVIELSKQKLPLILSAGVRKVTLFN